MIVESILVKRQLLARSEIVIKPSTVLNSTCGRIQHLFSPGGGRKVRQVCDGGNVQGLLGQCAPAIVATLGALATLNL
jgi:hypothetical protein